MKALLTAALAALFSASPAAADEWMPVREVSLELEAGSPLDFSHILPNGTIEAKGPLVADEDGHLAYARQPGERARMLCASLAWSPASGGFPPHSQAERYARQLAMHGYNIARFHFVDASLMFGRERDFDFDPETLDRIHYLLAALKRNGIYWIMDGLSSWRGAYGGYDDRWDPSSTLKLDLHLDPEAQSHWARLQEKFLLTVNPYTGVAPIEDEALALIILVNEGGIEFESVVQERAGQPHYDQGLQAPFNLWLKAKYGSTADLAKSWPSLEPHERLEDGTVGLPEDRYEDSPRMRDLQAFFIEVERRSTRRMTATLRALGYRGLISNYNNWPSVQASLSRADLPVITMNTYHDWVGSYAPGASIQQKSSVADAASYMRMTAATRWLDRPFVVSEYDHLFWNRYRYEAGLLLPAYAAFQDWDVLCRHAHGPIVLSYGEPYAHKRAMLPYAIALDPVARAGETLAALVFRRGDVRPSGVTVPFTVRGLEDLGEDMQARESEMLTHLALLTRIGLQAEGSGQADALAVTQPRENADPFAVLEALRRSGNLGSENATDPGTGRYQSDTGQIILDQPAGQLLVSTPRTQAAAFSSLQRPVDLGVLRVERADGNALVSASTLDGLGLEESRRILLIFATDARNSEMRFRDAEEKVIQDFGRLPVLIRKGELDLAFEGRSAAWRISPVGLDGKVHPAVASGDGSVAFRLSNETPQGPTTFFLLEIDEHPEGSRRPITGLRQTR